MDSNPAIAHPGEGANLQVPNSGAVGAVAGHTDRGAEVLLCPVDFGPIFFFP